MATGRWDWGYCFVRSGDAVKHYRNPFHCFVKTLRDEGYVGGAQPLFSFRPFQYFLLLVEAVPFSRAWR
jgi:hypothetical protein